MVEEEIPKVDSYTGDFPDRKVQDRDTFAENIFSYIKWAGTSFIASLNVVINSINSTVAQLNEWVDAVNAWQSEVSENANIAKALRDETAQYKQDIVDLKNDVVGIQLNIEANKADIEVDVTQAKTDLQDILNGATASLPAGTIIDSTTTDSTTWSSKKLSAMFGVSGNTHFPELKLF